MIFGALPNGLEDVCLGQQKLDVVVGPGVCRKILQENDHFLEKDPSVYSRRGTEKAGEEEEVWEGERQSDE